nr:hypothetical protein [uncultured Rhodopila sp.]
MRKNSRVDGGYVNLVDPHAWFALERLPGRGYEKWATTMAGVSLTVGLLFTFVGLSAALFQVGGAGADTNQLRLAIAEILQISSAKFITSMAGIVAFIAWTLVARAHASSQAKAVQAFAAGVQQLTAYTTPEALLLEQVEQSREQNERLKHLADEMAVAFDRTVGQRLDALPAAVGAALQPAIEKSVQPLIDAVEGMGTTIGSGNHTALENMITGLVSGVHDATGREMALLVEAMREAAAELRTAKSGIGATGAEFGDLLARAAAGMEAASIRMAEAMERRAGEIEGRIQRIDKTLEVGASRFDSMGTAMSHQMADGLAKAMEVIAAAAREGATTAREQAQAGLAPVLAELNGLISRIRASAEDSRGALVAGGSAAAHEIGAAMTNVSAKLTEASTEASGAVAQSFRVATLAMTKAVEDAVAGYQAATNSLAARLAVVEDGFRSLEQMVRTNVGQLEAAGGALSGAGQTFRTASDHLQRTAAPIASTVTSIESAANGLQEALRLVTDTNSVIRETAAAMAASSEATLNAFRGYEQRFAGVDDSLAATFGHMRDGVVQLGDQVKEVNRQYQEVLARAVDHLRIGVEDLSEALEGAGDRVRTPA